MIVAEKLPTINQKHGRIIVCRLSKMSMYCCLFALQCCCTAQFANTAANAAHQQAHLPSSQLDTSKHIIAPQIYCILYIHVGKCTVLPAVT